MSFLSGLAAKDVLVIGAGTSGKAVANFLKDKVQSVSFLDEKVSNIEGFQVVSEVSSSSKYEIAIVSPGWRKDHEFIGVLKSTGTQVISELDFAWRVKEDLAPNQKWVAITGTNGKTTTVQMLENILKSAKVNAVACGNVGFPAISAVVDKSNYEILALELSSFQIDWSELPTYEAISVLNIAEDHIDWHETFANYAQAKLKLLNKTKCAVLNLADPEIVLRTASWNGKKVFFGLDTPQSGEIGLVEELLVDRAFVVSSESAEVIAELSDIHPMVPHNVANAMAAAGIALALGVPHPVVKEGLASFKLDHHRLELVKELNGINWVNDSKATNPHAALAALGSHTSNIWIAGGLAKGAKMDALVQKSAKRIKAAILIGTDRELIASALSKFAPEVQIFRLEKVGTAQDLMDAVVSKAMEISAKGDTVLLAPACASMDQFTSYAQRGECFAHSVIKLVK
jgi:UDP-N-acetylmuramoylalanine--D-glutamate ligase